ncbi:hypothetical protein B0E38_01804 [Streptomyces sp. 111WW2]|uniref:hypothetical protein n=1 Tax=Streptomyces sp. 111WW2 TaxID=1945515 RepID=UPI000D0C8D2C|nr:hypothetical protein [Streptomyces sp. 111WW2]PSK57959.1 hypothetical protein B0E38_01804 [Streptomyces sp. 111WW2]
MGGCLTPTPDMEPWYNAEVSEDFADLGAPVYIIAGYRAREDERNGKGLTYTDEERAGAWLAVSPGQVATPAAPVSALLAALDQVIHFPPYERWTQGGGTPAPEDVAAELRPDGRLLLTAPHHRYAEDRDNGHVESIEIQYQHLAPLRDAVAALADDLCRCLHTRGEHLDNPLTHPGPFCATCATLPPDQRSAPHNHTFTPMDTGPVTPAGEDPFPARWWVQNP